MIDISLIFMDEIEKMSGFLSDLAGEAEGTGSSLYKAVRTIKPGTFIKKHPVMTGVGAAGLGALALHEHFKRKKAERAMGIA